MGVNGEVQRKPAISVRPPDLFGQRLAGAAQDNAERGIDLPFEGQVASIPVVI